MPDSISAMIAPSSGRSTVHHQSDSGLRSSRESMGFFPGAKRVLPLAPMVVSKGLMDFLTLEIVDGGASNHTSSPAKAGDPVRRGFRNLPRSLWDTGSPG